MPLDDPYPRRSERADFTITMPDPFRVHVTASEPKSIGALAFRIGFWLAAGAAMGAMLFLSMVEAVKHAAAWIVA